MKYRINGEDIKKNYGTEILLRRGIKDVEKFLNPTEDLLEHWSYLDNIFEGCNLIKNTIYSNKPYALIKDCDVDGATSSAIIELYLKRLNPDKIIDSYIHSGKQHGLEDLYENILEKDYELIIIPDAGTNDSKYAKFFNCPILILDHHLFENGDISSNMIIINNQMSDNYLNKHLSGAGIVWQFCRALDETFAKDWAYDYIDLAALGICADMMDVREPENQYILKKGFNNINNFFFEILLEKQAYSMGDKINPITVAFYIVPMINAMIRVGSMDEKRRLYDAFVDGKRLVPCNKRGAKGTMERLAIESARECTNAKVHQDKKKKEVAEALEIKIHKHGLLDNKILFIRLDEDDDFPAVLNGLVCMQLSQKYNRPTILGRLNDEGFIRGSARGLNKNELKSFKTLLSNTNLFEYTAGHDNAFGISIKNEYLDRLHNYANTELANINFGENVYDVSFIRDGLSPDLSLIIEDLSNYEFCWGQNNDCPLIFIDNIFIKKEEIQVIGKNKDTIKFEKNGISYIKFFAKDLIKDLEKYDEMKISVIGKTGINEWMGRRSCQILIEDIEIEDSLLAF